jgi:hypothetical protein
LFWAYATPTNATEPGLKPNADHWFRELYLTPSLWFNDFSSRGSQVGTGLVTDVLLREHGSLSKIRRRVEGLGPYQSLLLLAVAMSIVEPLKLIALAIETGTLVIVAAYATSLLLVERLFRIVKPS